MKKQRILAEWLGKEEYVVTMREQGKPQMVNVVWRQPERCLTTFEYVGGTWRMQVRNSFRISKAVERDLINRVAQWAMAHAKEFLRAYRRHLRDMLATTADMIEDAMHEPMPIPKHTVQYVRGEFTDLLSPAAKEAAERGLEALDTAVLAANEAKYQFRAAARLG